MYPATHVHEITDVQLGQVWRSFPQKSLKTRTAPFKTFFKWARQTRRIESNPIELMPRIKTPRKPEIDVFSEAEIDLLLSLPVVDAAPLALFFEAGLRRREAMEMTLRRISPDAVKVINGKGGKDRRIPTSLRLGQLLADLELLEGVNPDDHILYAVRANSHGFRRVQRATVIGEATFARWWRGCLETAGVRYRNPHTARHSCATRWRRDGHQLDDISDWLGHADISTTRNLYLHSTFEETLERFRLVEAGIA